METGPPNLMPPPPESSFQSQEELYRYITEWAAMYNYCFRAGRSTLKYSPFSSLSVTGSRKIVTYQCSRAGQPPAVNRPQNDPRRPQNRTRSTSTQKTGCEFSILAVQLGDGSWELRYRREPKFALHNHQPSSSTAAHAEYRQLSHDDKDIAKQLFNAGKNPLLTPIT